MSSDTQRYAPGIDYKCIYLTGEPEVMVNWGLYKEHWKRVDGT